MYEVHLPKVSCSQLWAVDLWMGRIKGRAYIDGHWNSPSTLYTGHNGGHLGNALALNHFLHHPTKREFFLSYDSPCLFCAAQNSSGPALGEININQSFFLSSSVMLSRSTGCSWAPNSLCSWRWPWTPDSRASILCVPLYFKNTRTISEGGGQGIRESSQSYVKYTDMFLLSLFHSQSQISKVSTSYTCSPAMSESR